MFQAQQFICKPMLRSWNKRPRIIWFEGQETCSKTSNCELLTWRSWKVKVILCHPSPDGYISTFFEVTSCRSFNSQITCANCVLSGGWTPKGSGKFWGSDSTMAHSHQSQCEDPTACTKLVIFRIGWCSPRSGTPLMQYLCSFNLQNSLNVTAKVKHWTGSSSKHVDTLQRCLAHGMDHDHLTEGSTILDEGFFSKKTEPKSWWTKNWTTVCSNTFKFCSPKASTSGFVCTLSLGSFTFPLSWSAGPSLKISHKKQMVFPIVPGITFGIFYSNLQWTIFPILFFWSPVGCWPSRLLIAWIHMLHAPGLPEVHRLLSEDGMTRQADEGHASATLRQYNIWIFVNTSKTWKHWANILSAKLPFFFQAKKSEAKQKL